VAFILFTPNLDGHKI